jgi:hypothetical protein
VCRRAGLQERCKYVLASDAIAEEQQLAVEMEGLDDEVGRLNFCLIISFEIILYIKRIR